MPYTELCKQGVDGAELDSVPAAGIAQLGSTNVVLSVRPDEGQGSKTLNDIGARAWSGEPL